MFKLNYVVNLYFSIVKVKLLHGPWPGLVDVNGQAIVKANICLFECLFLLWKNLFLAMCFRLLPA